MMSEPDGLMNWQLAENRMGSLCEPFVVVKLFFLKNDNFTDRFEILER